MLAELLRQKKGLEAQLADIQEKVAAVNTDIEHMVAERLLAIRQIQGKETGAVSIMLDGIKVTETVPKKVEWDQDKMQDLYIRIAASGDDPKNYMKMKLEVPEKAYDAFSEEVQAFFKECRTVKHGKPSLKFDLEAKNA